MLYFALLYQSRFKKQQLLCAKELQTLLTALLQSDKNGDHNLSPQELEVLLLRCQSFSVTDEIKLRDALMQASAGANVSTTSLYNAAVASSFADDDEVKDFTLGYGNWLFDEEAVDAA